MFSATARCTLTETGTEPHWVKLRTAVWIDWMLGCKVWKNRSLLTPTTLRSFTAPVVICTAYWSGMLLFPAPIQSALVTGTCRA